MLSMRLISMILFVLEILNEPKNEIKQLDKIK